MNSNEILNKYINLIDKGYCSDCNELNCIDNFPYAKIIHAIRELQQENKQLKNKIKELVKYGFGTDMSLGEFKEFYKLGTGKDYDPKKCPEVE